MANKKMSIKAIRKILTDSSNSQRVVALAFAALFAVAGVYTLLFSHAAVTSARLYLSPASQTVTTGSTVVVTVMIDTGGASVNTAQSVLTYSAANFSLVSITPSAAFASFPNPVETSGSIQFSAGSTTAQTGVQTVATVTLTATGTGTSAISLAGVCPAGNFGLTCSAAYDSVTSNNDLGTVTNGSYTVNPVLPTVPTGLNKTGSTTTSVSLAWTASTDTGGPGLAGYHVYRNNTFVGSTAGTTYTDSGLTAGTSYSYTVKAYDTAGNTSAASSPLSVSTPTITGDLDGDGHVTGHDLSILLANYGTNYAPAEFDGTNVVEAHDLSILLSNYGK
jgi:chitinase